MEEIIFDKSSEEYKAIEWLKNKTNDYSEHSLILHYNNTLYYLIVNLMKKNKKLEENYERIYNENCILREKHNINDIGLLDENYKLKQVIDKAIEYIKQCEEYDDCCNGDEIIWILKGED